MFGRIGCKYVCGGVHAGDGKLPIGIFHQSVCKRSTQRYHPLHRDVVRYRKQDATLGVGGAFQKAGQMKRVLESCFFCCFSQFEQTVH